MLRLFPHLRNLVFTLAFCASYGAVTAEAQDVTLTVTVDGVVSGAVGLQGLNANVCNPNPGGSAGSGTCVFTYPVNTPLRIAANSPNPDAGFLHGGTGDLAGCTKSTCNIVLTTDSAITATFDASQGPVVSIATTLMGGGTGNVGTDNGQCQNFELGYTSCKTYYALDSQVKFVGRSMPGNIFVNFSDGVGDTAACGSASTCVFTATTNSTVKATFEALASVAIEPGSITINAGNNAFLSARATFTNGMTRFGFSGNTPWQSHVPMDVERFSLAAAVVNDRLYAIGGVNGFCPTSPCEFEPVADVEIFNPNVTAYAEFEQAWMPRTSMTTPRGSLAAVAVEGKIYAFGGYTLGGGPVASMEVFDPVANTWAAGASMSGPRAGMAAAVINNTIYAVGGADAGGSPSTTVEAYDTLTDSWTGMAEEVAQMLTARNGAAAAAVNGVLYVIGGDGAGTVEAYDPVDNSWSTRASMPGGGGSHTAVALNGLIYAVGGSPSNVKVYNPALNSWATLTSTSAQPSGQIALAVLDGRLFAAGGNTVPDNIAVGTLLANRPPEATWWSNNSAVGRINAGNNGSVNGVSTGTATISARLVGVDSGDQSAVLTVSTGGGGGGSSIFVNGPNEAFTQPGNANWGCGSFMQNNSTGPWTATVNYGEPGGIAEPLTIVNPDSGGCAGPGAKGAFVFNHAYASTGTFHAVVTVENDVTHATGTDEFDVHVEEGNGGGGGGEDECVPIISNIATIGTVPFDRVMVAVFDRVTGQLLTDPDTALPLGLFDEASLPDGQYRFEFSVPDGYDGYMVTPSSVDVDAVCGQPIHLNLTVKAIPAVPPTIVSLTPSKTILSPPNHKYHAITIAAVARDASGANISGQCSIVSASSNEPNTDNDWVITGSLSIDLRAERLGNGNGRIYTITVRCTDADGLSATGTALVKVPHDKSHKHDKDCKHDKDDEDDKHDKKDDKKDKKK